MAKPKLYDELVKVRLKAGTSEMILKVTQNPRGLAAYVRNAVEAQLAHDGQLLPTAATSKRSLKDHE